MSKVLQFPSAEERTAREQERLGREFDRFWFSGKDCTELLRVKVRQWMKESEV